MFFSCFQGIAICCLCCQIRSRTS